VLSAGAEGLNVSTSEEIFVKLMSISEFVRNFVFVRTGAMVNNTFNRVRPATDKTSSPAPTVEVALFWQNPGNTEQLFVVGFLRVMERWRRLFLALLQGCDGQQPSYLRCHGNTVGASIADLKRNVGIIRFGRLEVFRTAGRNER